MGSIQKGNLPENKKSDRAAPRREIVLQLRMVAMMIRRLKVRYAFQRPFRLSLSTLSAAHRKHRVKTIGTSRMVALSNDASIVFITLLAGVRDSNPTADYTMDLARCSSQSFRTPLGLSALLG